MEPDELRPVLEARRAGWAAAETSSRPNGELDLVGDDDDAACWIAKNSWGSDWGEAGSFRIAHGQCAIDSHMWAVAGVSAPSSDD